MGKCYREGVVSRFGLDHLNCAGFRILGKPCVSTLTFWRIYKYKESTVACHGDVIYSILSRILLSGSSTNNFPNGREVNVLSILKEGRILHGPCWCIPSTMMHLESYIEYGAN